MGIGLREWTGPTPSARLCHVLSNRFYSPTYLTLGLLYILRIVPLADS